MSNKKHDYAKLGLKAGLEVHQQLDTGKLFSHAPSLLRSDKPDYVIKRKLHAVAGETGEVDVAVEYEAALDKELYYEGYKDSISLVELDEEPPNTINKEALEAALQLSLLLKAKIEPKIKVMRKIIIDGSNVAGFQRTMQIATNGKLKASKGIIKIETLLLEQEAAKKIATNGKDTT